MKIPFFKIFGLLMAVTAWLPLLTACTSADEPVTPGRGEEMMNLQFQWISSPETRASESDNIHDEAESEFRYFEDGIDPGDVALFLFASTEGSTDERLVLKMTDLAESENVTLYGAPGLYTVNIDILGSRLHSALGGMEIDPGASTRIALRILMLANSSSPGTNSQAKWNEITGETYTDVISQLDKWTFAMSYLYNQPYVDHNTPGDDLTQIYSYRKSNAPMFGTRVFTVTQKSLYESRPQNRLYLGEMDLLRSLAKIRVIDNMPKDAEGYPKIITADFMGSQDELKQLPHGALTYRNGTQVHTPNIGQPDNILNPVEPIVYRLGLLPDEWANVPATERTGRVRIGYVPEQRIGIVNGDTYHGRPIVRLSIAHSPEEGDVTTYEIPMTAYNGQTFSFGSNILRNHIYTLSVDITLMSLLKVDAYVRPYNVINLDPIFGFDR